MSEAARVVIIDSDEAVAASMKKYLLQRKGTPSSYYIDGKAALLACEEQDYDVLVCDAVRSDVLVEDIIKAARLKKPGCKVILTTGMRSTQVESEANRLSADLLLEKPVNIKEFGVYITQALGMKAKGSRSSKPGLQIIDRKLVGHTGDVVSLTKKEAAILQELMSHQGRPVSREFLTVTALGRELAYGDRSCDVHISNIRKKLKEAYKDSVILKPVRGKGYVLDFSS
ncbi:response regulator transcription factor [Sulfitobacter sp. R18_1]|uniref:response regulator transcription factor n=1 Tax=Sulfitobacter sp. R18_1 TaxID=2821104 RepID=UPI001ADD18EB|nr:response regulator transcription factor [Sulfitobacter sp. R18_1]MBO9428378.1 response regulator transcription factor [Sulfitobacter sp. R18_1]